MSNQDPITYFAQTDARGQRLRFGIKNSDRTKHMYLIGKSGMGKSTLLENLAAQDIQNGNGLCFIDPHGSAVDALLDYVPAERINDVLYFAPFDMQYPVAFNVMENLDPARQHLVAQGLLSAFKKIWGEDSFSDRMEHILHNCLLALLSYPGSTILGITRILTDKNYRKKVVDNITDPSVKAFWVNEYNVWDERYRKEASAAILNKVGQFTSNPLIRNIVGQEKSSFDFRQAMDEGKIILVNLSKGQVGEENGNLLGSMITTKVYLAAMSRADVTRSELASLPNFYLYVDEFQSVVNDSFANILSEARKYKLNLTIAHQYVEQMPETVRAAVFGNVGTMITFRVGATDAEAFSKEFAEKFLPEDFVNLGKYQVYLSLMIDGVGSQPFSATTLPPIQLPTMSFRDEVIEASRVQFANNKQEVEEKIIAWLGLDRLEQKAAAQDAKDKKQGDGPGDKQQMVKQAHQEAKDQALPGSADFAAAFATMTEGGDQADEEENAQQAAE